MYEDEYLNNLKTASREILRVGNDLYKFLKNYKVKNLKTANGEVCIDRHLFEILKELNLTAKSSFLLNGNITDLAAMENGPIDKSDIDNITVPRLKMAVYQTLETAEKEGLVEIDLENQQIMLSEKGQEYIRQPKFIEMLKEEQAKAQRNQALGLNNYKISEFGIELSGTDADLNFFKYAKNLNLRDIVTSPEQDTAVKIFENLGKLQSNGFVKFNSSLNAVNITDKGLQYMKSDMFNKSFGKAAEKSIGSLGVTGKVIVVTKRVIEEVAKLSTEQNSNINKQSKSIKR